MAVIKPFQAVRPASGLESRIAALPYDVYSRREAREAAAKDELSFLNIDRPETQFPEKQDMYAPEVYQKARAMLRDQIKRGCFVQDEKKCYYVYELTMHGRSQTGIVACASIDDYLSGVIAKHENTRAEKEEDRIRHVDACGAQTGPIFLAYRREETISRIVSKVKNSRWSYSFVSEDGVRHRGWVISSPEQVQALEQAFAGIDRIYIADGHHRAASAVKVGLRRREDHPGYDGAEEFNYFLSVLFPDDELMIMDYNRVVKDLAGMSDEEFLSRLGQVCAVQPLRAAKPPERKGTCRMFLSGKWYTLTFPEDPGRKDPVECLDVSILQRAVLTPLLGIENPRTDPRIDFVGGIRGLGALEQRCASDCAVAFAMFPTSIHELFDVADAHLLMPPKSTWFEPKLRSGLYLHLID